MFFKLQVSSMFFRKKEDYQLTVCPKMPSLNDLPNEVLVAIFSKLTIEQLCTIERGNLFVKAN